MVPECQTKQHPPRPDLRPERVPPEGHSRQLKGKDINSSMLKIKQLG